MFVVLLKNMEAPFTWERCEEIPEEYPDEVSVQRAIEDFSDSAAEAGFHYPVSDFKVEEIK